MYIREFSAALLLTIASAAEAQLPAPPPNQPPGLQPALEAKVPEKSYVLPAIEILGFQALLNAFNRTVGPDEEDYESDFNTIKENLEGGWELDRDSFNINQVGHPYQGSVYYGLSRSAGLNFYESFAYTSVGSAIWEIAGETTEPSVNDQITTSFGGSFLGEALFRTAETFFKAGERTADATPDVVGAVISPGTEVNRNASDKDVTPDLDRQRPPLFRAVQAGAFRNAHVFNPMDSKSIDRNVAELRFRIDYGTPGKPSYEYKKPFDYYNFDVGLSPSVSDAVDHLIVNGLIYGKEYDAGDSYQGIYGIYGNYNYIAPEVFRVASSALSFGSTAQWLAAEELAVQGTMLGGLGFGAAGSIHANEDDDRDYHYGAVPQALLNLRFIMGDGAALDLAASRVLRLRRELSNSGSGDENISQAQAAITVKVYGPHALSVRYGQSVRNAIFTSSPDQRQRVETYGLYYTYLFGESFGAIR